MSKPTEPTDSYLTEGDRAEVLSLVMACRASTRKATMAPFFSSSADETEAYEANDEFALRSLLSYLDHMTVEDPR